VKVKRLTLAVLFAALAAPAAHATSVSSRSALQTLFGGPGILENFENLSVFTPEDGSPQTAEIFDCPILDSSAICSSFYRDGGEYSLPGHSPLGPGLVVPGVSFTFGDTPLRPDAVDPALQVNAPGFTGDFLDPSGPPPAGALSHEILAWGDQFGDSKLSIHFASPALGFGFDLRGFAASILFGYPADYETLAFIKVFGADGLTLLDTLTYDLPDDGSRIFAGYHDAGGIGRVELTRSQFACDPDVDFCGPDWSPIIDDVEFQPLGEGAAPVPEPGTLILLGAGLGGVAVSRRRRN
jgi:hypothetical protein